MVANLLNAAESNPRLVSPPEVVAKAIGRAVTARRPRTRYAVGGGAKPILLLRRLLTDRAYDRFTVRMFRAIGDRHARRQPSSKVVTAK